MSNTQVSRRETTCNENTSIIDDYVLERIDYRSRRLAIQFGFTDEQREDLSQDMVVEVLSAMPKFDPAQSNRKTFISRVLDNFVKNAIRTEIHRRQRECDTPVPLEDISEGYTPVVNDPRQGQLSEAEQLDTQMDVAQILSQMPRHLQKICSLLKTHSITETAKKLRINRTAIYRQLAEIREHFQRSGYGYSDFCATESGQLQI